MAPEGLVSVEWGQTGPLEEGLRLIPQDFPSRFSMGESAIRISFRALEVQTHSTFRIIPSPDEVLVEYSDPTSAFRALGRIMGCAEQGLAVEAYTETAAFRTRGVMIDASRNGVPRVETVELILRRMALMGLNRLMLYCEDTYEVPDQPFFGYYRGRYTQTELRAIDEYAALFGIEVIPCIQTLGHMEQALQWPHFAGVRDTTHVLVAEDDKTYQFIDEMLRAASEPMRSREIHIGMDEAHGVGSGLYRLRFGLKNPFEILCTHLDRVVELCAKHGLRPMIWSDMFFRLASPSNHYYDRSSEIPKHVAAHIPKGVKLVYWDYYHTDEEFYTEWIARHRALGHTPVFAAGVWTWNRFWAALPHTVATMRPGMDAARKAGLDEVFATMWGDDGAECDLLSCLPGLQYFAEKCFTTDAPDAALHFQGSSGGNWKAWHLGSELDRLNPEYDASASECPNPSKWLLWHDPLLGFLDAHMESDMAATYNQLATDLASAADIPGDNTRLVFPALLAETVAQKCALHLAVRAAYADRDLRGLRQIWENDIPHLQNSVTNLHRRHEELWHKTFKPFGWEVIDRRYGGLLARLQTLRNKLSNVLNDPAYVIEELEVESLPLCAPEAFGDVILTHARASTPSTICS